MASPYPSFASDPLVLCDVIPFRMPSFRISCSASPNNYGCLFGGGGVRLLVFGSPHPTTQRLLLFGGGGVRRWREGRRGEKGMKSSRWERNGGRGYLLSRLLLSIRLLVCLSVCLSVFVRSTWHGRRGAETTSRIHPTNQRRAYECSGPSAPYSLALMTLRLGT